MLYHPSTAEGFHSRLSDYEHQSTYSSNLLLRYLFYVANLYSSMTKDANLYGTKLIPVPAPKFLIFYNGKAPYPERQELRLSASFNVPDEEPSLELRATLLNINPGYNEDLKRACKTLNDYSVYTARVRLYAEIMKLEKSSASVLLFPIRKHINLSRNTGFQTRITTSSHNKCNYLLIFLHSKKNSTSTVLFREGISFLWGIAKNYIMYWGGYK